MTFVFKTFVASVILSILSSTNVNSESSLKGCKYSGQCPAWTTPGLQCPTFYPKMSWSKYLSNNYPEHNKDLPSYAGADFRYAKTVLNPPPAIGNIDTGHCYWLRYADPSLIRRGFKPGWESMRYIPYEGSTREKIHVLDGQPGNPLDYEVNIDGTMLKFNEGGEILDRRGRKVGQLTCYVYLDCEQYRVK